MKEVLITQISNGYIVQAGPVAGYAPDVLGVLKRVKAVLEQPIEEPMEEPPRPKSPKKKPSPEEELGLEEGEIL